MSSTDTEQVSTSVQGTHPVMAPVLGLAVYLGAVVLNRASDAGEPAEQTLREWVITLAMAGVGVAIAAWASRRAATRGASSMARTALILGIVAALTFVVFWTGFPCVFGAAALGLGLASRPSGGRMSTPAVAGVLLGGLALVAGAITMVVG